MMHFMELTMIKGGGIEEPLIGSFLRVACWFVDLIFTLRFEQSEGLILWIATRRR